MAIWQFKMELLSTNNVRSRIGEPPSRLPAEFKGVMGYYSTNGGSFWTNRATSAAASYFLKALREAESWTPDALMFGAKDGNKAEIWDDSIVVRADCRNLDDKFLVDVLRIATELECSLLSTETGWVVPAEKDYLVREIECSTAMRFASNPEATLRSLKLRR